MPVPSLTPLSTPPGRAADDFDTAMARTLGEIDRLVDELNAAIPPLNAGVAAASSASASSVAAAEYAAQAQAQAPSAWAAGTAYSFPQVAVGSDGHAYRCLGTAVLGVNPVGDATGSWLRLTTTALVGSGAGEVPTNGMLGTGAYQDLAFLTASFSWDPGSLDDGAGETKSVTVPGAAFGDFVMVAAPYDLQDMTCAGYVQAANTVEIRLQNQSGATVNLGSGPWNVRVMKYIAR